MKRYLSTAEKKLIINKYIRMGFPKEKAQEKLEEDQKAIAVFTSKERKERCMGGITKKKVLSKQEIMEDLKCKG